MCILETQICKNPQTRCHLLSPTDNAYFHSFCNFQVQYPTNMRRQERSQHGQAYAMRSSAIN